MGISGDLAEIILAIDMVLDNTEEGKIVDSCPLAKEDAEFMRDRYFRQYVDVGIQKKDDGMYILAVRNTRRKQHA